MYRHGGWAAWATASDAVSRVLPNTSPVRVREAAPSHGGCHNRGLGAALVDMYQLARASAGVERMACVGEGNEATSFAAELDAVAGAAYRLCRALGCDPDEAADVLQDAALNAWRYRSSRRGEFAPWFLTIAANAARRRRRRWITLPVGWRAGSNDRSPQDAGGLPQAFWRLPPRRRAALWLRYGLDMTARDVGRSLGVSEAAARQLIHRAQVGLHAAMQAEGAE